MTVNPNLGDGEFWIVKDLRTGKYYLFDEDCSIARTKEEAEIFIECILSFEEGKYAKLVKVQIVEVDEGDERDGTDEA
jgi:hypothetical protein